MERGALTRMHYDGIDAAELARRLAAPSCLTLVRVSSTLDIIHDLAAEGAPAGSVVLADEQVEGRGRQGRRWHSPPGGGIWLGYLARPSKPIEGGVLGLRVGLAVVAALEALGVTTCLKWPNDVVVAGRKLAGILCEARWRAGRVEWIAVGVGMNVVSPVAPELADRAVALHTLRPDVSRVAVLERLVPTLHALSDAPVLSADERAVYARHDWLLGRAVVEPVQGLAEGLAADGSLMVRTASGVERVVGGGVVTA